MTQVSDKTILVLTVIAVFVTVGGILMILSRLGLGINLLTGSATVQYGTVNVTISSTVSINMVYMNMSFGSGTLDLNTDATLRNTTLNSTVNFALAYNSFQANYYALQYRNDGNVDVNVSFTGTTAPNFIGGTGSAFKINVTSNEVGSCTGTTNLPTNMTFANQYSLTDVTAAPQTICNVSHWEDSFDTVNIIVWLWIPSAVTPGLRNSTITLTAYSAGV